MDNAAPEASQSPAPTADPEPAKVVRAPQNAPSLWGSTHTFAAHAPINAPTSAGTNAAVTSTSASATAPAAVDAYPDYAPHAPGQSPFERLLSLDMLCVVFASLELADCLHVLQASRALYRYTLLPGDKLWHRLVVRCVLRYVMLAPGDLVPHEWRHWRAKLLDREGWIEEPTAMLERRLFPRAKQHQQSALPGSAWELHGGTEEEEEEGEGEGGAVGGAVVHHPTAGKVGRVRNRSNAGSGAHDANPRSGKRGRPMEAKDSESAGPWIVRGVDAREGFSWKWICRCLQVQLTHNIFSRNTTGVRAGFCTGPNFIVGQIQPHTQTLEGWGFRAMQAGGISQGYFRSNKLDGYGLYTYHSLADGELKEMVRYEGFWKRGMYDGPGKLTIMGNETHEGNFVHGSLEGKGVYTSKQGDRYEGEYVNGLRCGYGILRSADQSVYEGMFKDDLPHGQGKQTWPSGNVYEGSFVSGSKHGHGCFKWVSDGSVYLGSYVDDERSGSGEFEGWGQYKKHDGTIVEGVWKDGAVEGDGKLTDIAAGSVYVGGLLNGQKHGFGVTKWSDGESYRGTYEEGEPCGEGVHKRGDGYQYSGSFARGEYHGDGTLTDPWQHSFRCPWVHGKPTTPLMNPQIVSCIADGKCTKSFAGNVPTLQMFCQCKQCELVEEDGKGICAFCATSCHGQHDDVKVASRVELGIVCQCTLCT